MKPRIKWSGRFQHWCHYSSWVFNSEDRMALMFVLQINRANGKRN